MKCPVCPETALVMTERQGVEIDYCPKCRGVWLDRGELDKIVERSLSAPTVDPTPNPSPNPPPNAPSGYAGYPQGYSDHHGHHDKHGHSGGYRRKSWLGELFD